MLHNFETVKIATCIKTDKGVFNYKTILLKKMINLQY